MVIDYQVGGEDYMDEADSLSELEYLLADADESPVCISISDTLQIRGLTPSDAIARYARWDNGE